LIGQKRVYRDDRTAYTQNADGTFQAGPKVGKDRIKGGCIGLSALDCGGGKCDLLITTTSVPMPTVAARISAAGRSANKSKK
jgi:hypothetical protein